ncbi:MAG: ABC transporter permease [Chloroflexi bacterium]|nr:ABC transporter permease [Chloroflexota bacterium]MCY3582314.1 ABC transporter permease [Chloroflexota bacterium]MCY3717895.1 ABC transporter permease [Chloroflexota bacterium]MDE2649105.1 ABC transporter permease [Chloroflexota bacterium]MXV92127.1 ABC transporter permease [Chloroflexota bacterium]
MTGAAAGARVSRVVDDGSITIGEQRNLWQDAARRFRRNWLAVGGLVVVACFLVLATIGPRIAPYDFLEQNIMKAFQGPSAEHFLGTDDLGRDIFSRMLHGARTAALVAFSTTAISLFIGALVGAWSGIRGGLADEFLMWISDLIQAMPGLLLVILINTTLRRPIVNWFDTLYEQTRNPFFLNTLWLDYALVFSALALIGWPGLARLVRGQVLSINEEDYVLAARALGASEWHIMLRHVIPNALGPLIVAVTAGMGGAIFLEAGLSFLGIGIQPPNASWGSMLEEGRRYWQIFPHLMLIPAVTIGIVQVAFVFLGDGLNDALDPRRTT